MEFFYEVNWIKHQGSLEPNDGDNTVWGTAYFKDKTKAEAFTSIKTEELGTCYISTREFTD